MRHMVTATVLGMAAVVGTSFAAAQPSLQEPTARQYVLNGFDGVSVVGPHHVVISVGPEFSVRAEGPLRTLDDTRVEVEDGRLQIRPVEDERWERRRDRAYWDNYRPATFHVTLPRLASIAMIGSGDMRVDRVNGVEFAASVAGSGDVDIAGLAVDEAHFSIAGSGNLLASGDVERSHVSIAGSGNLRARGVRSREADVSIAGSGNAALTVQSDARVSIVGSGDVDIAGPARCAVSRLGSGRVRCAGEAVSG